MANRAERRFLARAKKRNTDFTSAGGNARLGFTKRGTMSTSRETAIANQVLARASKDRR